jgi:hypothetical protein
MRARKERAAWAGANPSLPVSGTMAMPVETANATASPGATYLRLARRPSKAVALFLTAAMVSVPIFALTLTVVPVSNASSTAK